MFHRAEFHGALLNRLPSSCGTFPSKRLESYTQQPGDVILLRFQDGSTATCNILLGADGVKSVVRKTMLHEAASSAESQHRKADAAELRSLSEPHFSGFFSYRALIPAEKLSSISPQHRALSSGAHVSYGLFRVFDHILPHAGAVPRQEYGKLNYITSDLGTLQYHCSSLWCIRFLVAASLTLSLTNTILMRRERILEAPGLLK